MTALAAGLTRGMVAGVATGFGLVVAPAFLGAIPRVSDWLPFGLGTALIDILKTGDSSQHVGAAVVALLLIPLALAASVKLVQRREV